MVMRNSLGGYGNGAGVVTPADHRFANGATLVTDSLGLPRPGLFWQGTPTVVSGKANMSYDIAAFSGAQRRSTGATRDVWLGGNDGTVNKTTATAPGSNSRIDLIIWWHREFALDGTGTSDDVYVVSGTAAATPSDPSLSAYPGAVVLARAVVGAGITATTSAVITQVAPFTAEAGGLLVFRTSSERTGFAPADGQPALQLDTAAMWQGSAGVWVPFSPKAPVAMVKRATGGQFGSGTPVDVNSTTWWTPTIVRGFAAYNGTWVVPATGVYDVYGALGFQGNGTGFRAVWVNRNATDANTNVLAGDDRAGSANIASQPVQFVEPLALAAGDVLRIFGYQDSGVTLAWSTDNRHSRFGLKLIG